LDTLPKFNSSPLKNDAWKTTLLLGWYIFRGKLLNFQGVVVLEEVVFWCLELDDTVKQ